MDMVAYFWVVVSDVASADVAGTICGIGDDVIKVERRRAAMAMLL